MAWRCAAIGSISTELSNPTFLQIQAFWIDRYVDRETDKFIDTWMGPCAMVSNSTEHSNPAIHQIQVCWIDR